MRFVSRVGTLPKHGFAAVQMGHQQGPEIIIHIMHIFAHTSVYPLLHKRSKVVLYSV